MAAFEYRQAQEIQAACHRRGVRYLFIGKSGAILLGFPDTTQDATLFVERTPDNCRALVAALRELGFALTEDQAKDIERLLSADAASLLPPFHRTPRHESIDRPPNADSISCKLRSVGQGCALAPRTPANRVFALRK
jgi:hypothetical protein